MKNEEWRATNSEGESNIQHRTLNGIERPQTLNVRGDRTQHSNIERPTSKLHRGDRTSNDTRRTLVPLRPFSRFYLGGALLVIPSCLGISSFVMAVVVDHE